MAYLKDCSVPLLGNASLTITTLQGTSYTEEGAHVVYWHCAENNLQASTADQM